MWHWKAIPSPSLSWHGQPTRRTDVGDTFYHRSYAYILIILIVKIIQTLFKKFGKSFYNISFNEGSASNTLEIVSKKRIDVIEKNENLVNYLSDFEKNQYIYRLSFINKNSLENFRDSLSKEKDIEKVNVVFN